VAPGNQLWPLVSPLLSDSNRGVRIRAASLLAVVPTSSQPAGDRERFERAAAEFIAALGTLTASGSTYTVTLPTLMMDYRGDAPSVVVLPFTTMGAESGADYFCDGLTDEIITDLSSVHSLRIICRASAMQLKGTRESPQKVARDLNVRYVLEGSVRLSKNTLDGNTMAAPPGDVNALKTRGHWDGGTLHLHYKQGMNWGRDILDVSGGTLTIVRDLESGGQSTTRTITYTRTS